jgi:lipopolysaccharide export LptBFGC system permease protein LptF
MAPDVKKAGFALFAFLLLLVLMVSVFSSLKNDQPHDNEYYNQSNSSVNGSVKLTGDSMGTSTQFLMPFALVLGILFLWAAFTFLGKSRGKK